MIGSGRTVSVIHSIQDGSSPISVSPCSVSHSITPDQSMLFPFKNVCADFSIHRHISVLA